MGDETRKFINSMEGTTEPLIRETTRITLGGVSEKMDYRDEAREIEMNIRQAANVQHYIYDGSLAILALLDKVRQAQASECAKHKPSFNLESCMADGCDWKFGNGKITWSEHISALGRK